MAEDQAAEEQVEAQIGVTQPDAFEQVTSGVAVTSQHIFAGGDGTEKEVTVLSRHAGASSDAPSSSGIPSAKRQNSLNEEPQEDQPETPLGDRVLPTTQNLEP